MTTEQAHRSPPVQWRPPSSQRFPPFSTALIVVCVLMYALEQLVPQLATSTLPSGEVVGVPRLALNGILVALGQWWRVPGSVLEHGGPIHLLFNMSVVYSLGMQLERELGTARFAAISVVTALGGSAMVLWLDFTQTTVGASGMILGWAGAMLPIANQQARKSLGVWLLQIAVISLLPFVSWTGHLGGFLAGLACGFLLRGGRKVFWTVIPALAACVAAVCALAVRRGAMMNGLW